MNENMKKKIANLKQKAKEYAPVVITWTAAAASVALATNAIIKASKAPSMIDIPFEPLPEVTGERKKEILERDDLVLQATEVADVYFLSVMGDNNTEN